MRIDDPGKIAIVRANGFGDIFFALPAVEALSSAFPKARLVWYGTRVHKEFLERRRVVDKVVEIPPYPGITLPLDRKADRKALEGFFAAARKEDFDLAIQMHGGGKFSNIFAKRLGARLTIGTRTPDAPALDLCVPYFFFHTDYHRWLDVLSLIGVSPVTLASKIQPLRRDIIDSLRVFPETGRKFAVVHPGSADPKKKWNETRFGRVADHLAGKGMDVVVTGTPVEEKIVKCVVSAMKKRAVNLCGRLSLGALTGLMSRASLVISNDTGPLHLAEALDTPSVGIYWCGNVIDYAPASRRLSRVLISWVNRCPACGKEVSGYPSGMNEIDCHHVSYIDDVTADEVIAASDDLLSPLYAFG